MQTVNWDNRNYNAPYHNLFILSYFTSRSVSGWVFTHQLKHLHFLMTHLWEGGGGDLFPFACIDSQVSTLLIEEYTFLLCVPFWLRLRMDLHLFGLLVHMHLWLCLQKYISNYLFCKLSGNK